jgi:hypothetical protein
VNTVCSIASYYGVGLEVLRTDFHHSLRKTPNYEYNKNVESNYYTPKVMEDSNILSRDAAGKFNPCVPVKIDYLNEKD